LYGETFSFAWTKRFPSTSDRPAPDSPDLASTTIPSVATSPAATSGASASRAAVG
jgi:hypothetical protein